MFSYVKEGFSFSRALKLMKLGGKLRRVGEDSFIMLSDVSGFVVKTISGSTENPSFPSSSVYIPIDKEDALRFDTVFLKIRDNLPVITWVPTSEDLLADDWELAETLIISAFPGVGKSYLFENCCDIPVLDSDSSKFDKSVFPMNYIEHIKENFTKFSFGKPCQNKPFIGIICVSSHGTVRNALVDARMRFTLVFPHPTLKKHYIERYVRRGSDSAFVDILDRNWDNWIEQVVFQKKCFRVMLGLGEYLSDRVLG